MSLTTNENWAAAAPAYLHNISRVTTVPSHSLVSRVSALLPLTHPSSTAFDNGCGTGALTAVLKARYPHIQVLATDASDGMVSTVQRRITEEAWVGVTARVVDGRQLHGIQDGSFTHVFSTFMVCLAPEPEKIVREMHRVTKAGGVLGLAVWGDPRVGMLTKPWDRACREQVAGYETPPLMDVEWTGGGDVRGGLERAGFRDVEVWEEDCVWGMESAEALAGYMFDGGNPGALRILESFRARGGDVDKARPIFERVVREESGREDGSVELYVSATLATARK